MGWDSLPLDVLKGAAQAHKLTVARRRDAENFMFPFDLQERVIKKVFGALKGSRNLLRIYEEHAPTSLGRVE